MRKTDAFCKKGKMPVWNLFEKSQGLVWSCWDYSPDSWNWEGRYSPAEDPHPI